MHECLLRLFVQQMVADSLFRSRLRTVSIQRGMDVLVLPGGSGDYEH